MFRSSRPVCDMSNGVAADLCNAGTTAVLTPSGCVKSFAAIPNIMVLLEGEVSEGRDAQDAI